MDAGSVHKRFAPTRLFLCRLIFGFDTKESLQIFQSRMLIWWLSRTVDVDVEASTCGKALSTRMSHRVITRICLTSGRISRKSAPHRSSLLTRSRTIRAHRWEVIQIPIVLLIRRKLDMLFNRRNIGTEAACKFWTEDIVAFAVPEYSGAAAATSEQ